MLGRTNNNILAAFGFYTAAMVHIDNTTGQSLTLFTAREHGSTVGTSCGDQIDNRSSAAMRTRMFKRTIVNNLFASVFDRDT